MSVPRDFGSNANKSWMSLSTCFRPFFGGTNNSTISENSSSPTLSLFWTALKASTAQISAAASRLKRVADPKDSEAETSTASSTVCSRSSSNTFTYVSPVRADTFQSICRTSSPIWYGRTSANSIPRPRNAEWASPPNTLLTRPRVRISRRRTFQSNSGVNTVRMRDRVYRREIEVDEYANVTDYPSYIIGSRVPYLAPQKPASVFTLYFAAAGFQHACRA